METVLKMIPVTYLKDEDFEHPLCDLYEIVEALEDTDGFFEYLTLSSDVARYLESKRVAKKSTRGAYSKGEKLSEFKLELECLMETI